MWSLLKRTKTVLLLVLLSFSLLGASVGSCSDQMYQTSPEELTQLEQIFKQLGSTTNQQSVSWLELNKQLEVSKSLTQNLQTQVRDSQKLSDDLKLQVMNYQKLTNDLITSQSKLSVELIATQNSLSKANESLTKYEQDVKAEISRIKAQRTIAYIAISVLLYKYSEQNKK